MTSLLRTLVLQAQDLRNLLCPSQVTTDSRDRDYERAVKAADALVEAEAEVDHLEPYRLPITDNEVFGIKLANGEIHYGTMQDFRKVEQTEAQVRAAEARLRRTHERMRKALADLGMPTDSAVPDPADPSPQPPRGDNDPAAGSPQSAAGSANPVELIEAIDVVLSLHAPRSFPGGIYCDSTYDQDDYCGLFTNWKSWREHVTALIAERIEKAHQRSCAHCSNAAAPGEHVCWDCLSTRARTP